MLKFTEKTFSGKTCHNEQEIAAACGIVSAEEVDFSPGIRLFPNPATNEIILEAEKIHEFSLPRPFIAGPAIFTLYDALGRPVVVTM